MKFGLLAIGIAVYGFVGAASADTVVRVGQVPSTAKSIGALPWFVGESRGFFTREGIKLQLVPLDGGTDQMVKRLDKGDVDLSGSATPYFIQAVMNGSSNSVAVAATSANPVYSLIVKPEIKNFADLKGKTLGLSLAIDTISISMRKLIEKNGVKDSDYTVKELVGTPVRLDCLKSGACDGTPLGQPEDFAAIGQGFHRLGVSTDAVANFEFTVLIARRDWAKANQATLVSFLRGLASSFRFIRDPAHRNDVAKIIVDGTGAPDATAHAILDLYFKPDRGVLPRAGELDLKGLAQVIAFMGEAGVLKGPLPKPDRFVDQRYLKLAGVKTK